MAIEATQHQQIRKPGYYWIKPTAEHDWVIGYWYEGIVDAANCKSAGYFDCSNHWDSDIHTLYSVAQVGKFLER